MPSLPSARRNFRLVLGASVASSLGDNLHNLALPLLVLTVTGSSSQAGLVLALGTVAQLLGGPVAGAVVDRLERRSVLIWCDAGRALLVASLPFSLAIGEFHMTQIYIVTVLLGALTTLFRRPVTHCSRESWTPPNYRPH